MNSLNLTPRQRILMRMRALSSLMKRPYTQHIRTSAMRRHRALARLYRAAKVEQ